MRGPNLDHLRAFADVIELGSFAAAAERAGLTQPAISQQIRQLEKRAGVRLVERVGRRATPTPAGTELLDHARRIDAAVAAAFDSVAQYAGGKLGRLRLGTGATACIYLLPPVLRELRRLLPAVEITIRTGNTAEILKAVEANSIDLGLVTLPAPGRMFDVTPLVADEFVAVTAPGGARLPARATPAQLARLPLLLHESGSNARRIVDGWFTRAGITPQPAMALGNVEAIKQLVGAGLGCGVLPRLAVQDDARHGRLLTSPLSPRLRRPLAFVLRRDKPLDRGLRAVVGLLKELAATRSDGSRP